MSEQREWAEADNLAIDYALRYGGSCRGCADAEVDGICDNNGTPCNPKTFRAAIWHALKAWRYGVEHGYIANPIALVPPAASAEAVAFGTYQERDNGVGEFRRMGEPHSPTASSYKFWTLYATPPDTTATIAALEGEVARLREALTKIAKGETVVFDDDLQTEVEVSADADEMSAWAREALHLWPTGCSEVFWDVQKLAYEAFPSLNWHIAKGRLTADDPLYGALLLDGEIEVGAGESDISPAYAMKAAILFARAALSDTDTKGGA